MKKLILFVVVGLSLGLGVGSYLGGSRERDVILERMAAEKAAAEAQEETSVSQAEGSEDGVSEPAGEDSQHASDDGQEEEEAGEHSEGPGQDEADPEESDPEESPEGEASEGGDDDAEDPPDAQPQASALASAVSLAESEELPPEGPARLAKIFGAMEAREAAAVLQNLKDGEVQAILLHMSNRKVAEILGEFEPERAAALSRIVLDSRSGATR